ncbi:MULTISPECIES: TatD family hydrolase [Chryseobacterium]|uniref:TatD DNase family protein n=1 Tax=Chryseobacterium camelliae TaxID=1265445 RepID=A0ABU0TP13_9FLAO|nr:MULTISPECIES: TatD family hydrolase [Chryseobacterium]MDT3408085.1 TatD DNase family protein [Pseudacidovorax intermedius]MDQ1098060.1 TatD DNase family protein [Chryseobacterium camelliae]MDQ1101990.1 TatD DNase family protein [Chryseobacterium sp. SORGH_AS_1048]MDR6085427.1 TatD DNase family protein [Chryseobacterium sp. SORGH_AS_0909]MDR6129791.1 TatD DNase family protein [Chryseobacterium sp. SORGH_AS_1175]
MEFFDFHHHKKTRPFGIYNADIQEPPPDFPYSAGIHPKDIDQSGMQPQLERLQELAGHALCIAIGECGLDSMVAADQHLQEEMFMKQIRISNDVGKPLIIHCVRKYYEVIAFRKKAEQAMVIHGFNKKKGIAEDLIRNNFHLSFGKAVLYNLSLQDTLKTVPVNRIFLETDHEDFDIAELYQKTAEIKGLTVEVLNEQIRENLAQIKNG